MPQSDIKDAMAKLQVSEKELKQHQERESNFGHVFGHVGSTSKGGAVN